MSQKVPARALWGLAMALVAGGLLLAAGSPQDADSWLELLVIPLQAVAFATVGMLIAVKRPDNSMGWLFGLVGAFAAAYAFTNHYQVVALTTRPGTLPWGEAAAWVQAWMYVPALVIFFSFVPLLFPTGRLLSRRWRPVAWLAAVALVAVTASDALAPGVISGSTVVNPFGIAPATHSLLEAVAFLAIFAPATILAFSSLVLRWRRGSTDERQQLKWFAFAAALLPVNNLMWVTFEVTGIAGPGVDALETVLVPVSFLGLPVATGVAILRYRLYDIDRVVSRTVSYGLLTAVLAGVYALGVFAVQDLAGVEGDLAVAGSTLAVAALFGPARRRLQGLVDRRFNRARYDAQRVVESFTSRLAGAVELDRVAGDLRAVAARTVQPSTAAVWIRAASR